MNQKHIYWGDGKGKTSALNGSAIRASGAGLRVVIFRFLKSVERKESEDLPLVRSGVKVIKTQKSKKFAFEMNKEEKEEAIIDVKAIIKYINEVQTDYDMIILDEFLDLASDDVCFFTDSQLKNFVNLLNCEVLMSGHTKLDELFKSADLITEFKSTKHYYDKGIKARKGIEY